MSFLQRTSSAPFQSSTDLTVVAWLCPRLPAHRHTRTISAGAYDKFGGGHTHTHVVWRRGRPAVPTMRSENMRSAVGDRLATWRPFLWRSLAACRAPRPRSFRAARSSPRTKSGVNCRAMKPPRATAKTTQTSGATARAASSVSVVISSPYFHRTVCSLEGTGSPVRLQTPLAAPARSLWQVFARRSLAARPDLGDRRARMMRRTHPSEEPTRCRGKRLCAEIIYATLKQKTRGPV